MGEIMEKLFLLLITIIIEIGMGLKIIPKSEPWVSKVLYNPSFK
jgi:hypothetical protein